MTGQPDHDGRALVIEIGLAAALWVVLIALVLLRGCI